MNRFWRIKIDWINLTLRSLIFIALASFMLLYITDHASYIWKGLMLFPGAIISFLIRKYSKHLWSFIILQLMLFVIYILLSDELVLKAIYGVSISVFVITEFILNIKKKIKNTPLVCSIILIAIHACCKAIYPEDKMVGLFFFIAAIVFGILYIVNAYQVNSYIYFKKHEEKVNIPMKKIRFTNTFYIGGFIILCLAAMMIFTRIPLAGIGRLFSDLIRWLLKLFISIAMLFKKEPEEINLEEEIMYSNSILISPEPTLFSQIANLLFVGFTIIVILAVVIYGIYRIYMLFQFKLMISEDLRIENIKPFVKDNNKIDKKSTIGPRIRTLFGNSNNVKIRRLYIRAVQKSILADDRLKYKLPKELSVYALGAGKAKIDEHELKKNREKLTVIYEKARYSNMECSKEEVKLVKDLLR